MAWSMPRSWGGPVEPLDDHPEWTSIGSMTVNGRTYQYRYDGDPATVERMDRLGERHTAYERMSRMTPLLDRGALARAFLDTQE